MKNAAIIIVPADWHVGQPVAVSQALYETYQQELSTGMHLAIMQAAPANQIVAQAELTAAGHPADIDEWDTQQDEPLKDEKGDPAAYVLPTKVIYHHADEVAIASEDVAKLVDFETLQREGFLPIEEITYRTLFKRFAEADS